MKNKPINRRAAMRVIGSAAGLVLGGCYQIPSCFKTSGKSFAFNNWEDANSNNQTDRKELRGARKLEFSSSEEIGFAMRFRDEKGARFRCEVYNGRGQVDSFDGVVPSRVWCARVPETPYKPGELAEKGGLGSYSAKWFVNGTLESETRITLLK